MRAVRAVLLRRDLHRPGARRIPAAGRSNLPARPDRRRRRRLGIMLALFVVFPDAALRLVGALGLLAAALAISLRDGAAIRSAWRPRARSRRSRPAPRCRRHGRALQLSPVQGAEPGAPRPGRDRSMAERSSPLGLLTVVSSPTVPLRHAPGLSLNNATEPPAQLGVFTDGDGLTAITAFDGDASRSPISTSPPRRCRIISWSSPTFWSSAPAAERISCSRSCHGAATMDAVELNPQIVELVAERFAALPAISTAPRRAGARRRRRAASSPRAARPLRLIQIPLLDSFAAAAAGHAQPERELRLHGRGVRAVSRSLAAGRLPRDHPLGEAAAARQPAAVRHRGLRARARGVGEPGRHLALVRGWNTATLLVKNGAAERPRTRARSGDFAEERAFDLAFLPGMARDEANRFNLLDQADFFDGAVGVARARARCVPSRLQVRHRADHRRPAVLLRFLQMAGAAGAAGDARAAGPALLDWGYLVLAATLIQAALLASS